MSKPTDATSLARFFAVPFLWFLVSMLPTTAQALDIEQLNRAASRINSIPGESHLEIEVTDRELLYKLTADDCVQFLERAKLTDLEFSNAFVLSTGSRSVIEIPCRIIDCATFEVGFDVWPRRQGWKRPEKCAGTAPSKRLVQRAFHTPAFPKQFGDEALAALRRP